MITHNDCHYFLTASLRQTAKDMRKDPWKDLAKAADDLDQLAREAEFIPSGFWTKIQAAYEAPSPVDFLKAAKAACDECRENVPADYGAFLFNLISKLPVVAA